MAFLKTGKRISDILCVPVRLNHSACAKREGPLSDIKVLDMTRIVAGPYCTMILGDLGADVIKIERPGFGDESRKWGPPFINNTSETCYFACLNRNKKSVCVDLKSEEGRQIIIDLSKKCDVLVENYVPGTLEKLGLGFDDLKNISPHLIYCSMTGYGTKGPYKNRLGYDVIASSVGGLMSITGPKDGSPCKVGVAMVDLATGLYAHGAIMAALLNRNKTGKGERIDCNLLTTQLACLINIGSNYLNAGEEGSRWGSSHVSIVPYRAYATKDNEFLTIGGGSDAQFKDLCLKLSLPELANDEKYLNNKQRVINRKSLDNIFEKQFKMKNLNEWLEIFEGSSFPYGPVNTMSSAFNDQHVKDIKIVKEIKHRLAGTIKVVGPAVEFSESINEVRSPPPELGEHTNDVLHEVLGYSTDKVNELRRQKIDVATVRLKLRKPKSRKKVNWTEETVDNEHMDKKKSKCCCIYKKPRAPDESSSDEESDDECEHCSGHVELKKKIPTEPNPAPADPTVQRIEIHDVYSNY